MHSAPRDGILRVLRERGALTKTELADALGVSRSAIAKRIEREVDSGLLKVVGTAPSSGGRPAELFGVNDGSTLLAIIDIAGSSFRVAIASTRGDIVATAQHEVSVTLGPRKVLAAVEDAHLALLRQYLRERPDVVAPRPTEAIPYAWAGGIAVSVPGPIDFTNMLPISPPIMVGWEHFDVLEHFRGRSANVPLYLDNDANAMAYAEYAVEYPDARMLYMLKAGTGIGSAYVYNGQPIRGSHGAAGDIGHTSVIDDSLDANARLPLCRCGNFGCIEAFSGGWALVKRAQEMGSDISRVSDLVARARASDPIAVQLIRSAGRHLGHLVATAVGLLNPDVVVVNGQLTEADDHLMAGIREIVYSRAQPSASRRLRIETSSLGHLAGVTGLARQLVRTLPAPSR